MVGNRTNAVFVDYSVVSHGYIFRKLVQFGLVNGLIRKLHKYPVRLPADYSTNHEDSVMKYFDGLHCFDDISQLTGMYPCHTVNTDFRIEFLSL